MTTASSSSHVRVTRINAEKRLVTGWAYVAEDADGNQVVDFGRAILPASVLEEGAIDFMRRNTQLTSGIMHMKDSVGNKIQAGVLVESFVFTREKWAALGGKPPGAPTAGWLVTSYVENDAVWEDIKRGILPEFSISATAEVRYLDA